MRESKFLSGEYCQSEIRRSHTTKQLWFVRYDQWNNEEDDDDDDVSDSNQIFLFNFIVIGGSWKLIWQHFDDGLKGDMLCY